jgi:hypothetical protein
VLSSGQSSMEVVDSPIEVRITNMAALVVYSEMERAAVYLARPADDAELDVRPRASRPRH